jgi:hypothetical protein
MTANDLMMERKGDSLTPVAEQFRTELHAFPEKRQLVVNVRLAEDKTDEMRAWLWYLVKKLREAGVWDGDAESCMDHLKINTGYFATIVGAPTFGEDVIRNAQYVITFAGGHRPEYDDIAKGLATAIIEAGPRQHYVPKSIARGAISAQNMSRLVERIEHYVATHWGVDPNQFKKERAPEKPEEASTKNPTTREQLEHATLHDQLVALGFELGMIDKWDMPGVEGLRHYWEKAKKTKRIKALYAEVPNGIKALYDMAELNARGLTEKYDDEVRAIATDAVRNR